MMMATTKKKTSSTKKKKEAVKVRKQPPADSYGTFGRKGTVFEGKWRDLAEAVGGVQELATAVGVSYPTLYRWAVAGAPIPETAKIVLGMIAATKRLPNPAI